MSVVEVVINKETVMQEHSILITCTQFRLKRTAPSADLRMSLVVALFPFAGGLTELPCKSISSMEFKLNYKVKVSSIMYQNLCTGHRMFFLFH